MMNDINDLRLAGVERAKVTRLFRLGILLFAAVATQASAQTEITIVAPSGWEEEEGNSRGDASTELFRVQYLLDRAYFQDLASLEDRYQMTSIAWRPDETTPPTQVSGELRLTLATTQRDQLSMRFAENLGDDAIMVRDGPFELMTAAEHVPGDFDFVAEFDQPFVYEPSQGNLVIDLWAKFDFDDFWVDFVEFGTGERLLIEAGGGRVTRPVAEGYWDALPVLEFTFTPVLQLRAGDADMDLDFDQLDLVQVQIAAKYLAGQPATWGEGDWNGAPGGERGSPPVGNGVFDQVDIIAALAPGHYLTGPYAAVSKAGQRGDGQTSIIYDAGTGEVAVDAPAGVELTSINIDSAAGIFTGQAAANLGGSFDNDADANIFKATFGSSFGSVSFGNVAQVGLSEQFVLSDLTVVGSLAGGGGLGDVDLVYVPEPTTIVLSAFAMLFVAWAGAHAKRGQMKMLAVLFVTATAMSASADTILIDDFNDGNADGWRTTDLTTGQPHGPGTFDASSGAYQLQGAELAPVAALGAGSALITLWDASSDPIFSDGFLRATIRAEEEGNVASLVLRGNLPTAGYFFFGNSLTNTFRFNTLLNGEVIRFEDMPEGPFFDIDEDWNIEAGAVGDELSMKVWRLGDPEPESPQWTFTDTTLSAGDFGLIAAADNRGSRPARVSSTFDDIYFTFPDGVAAPGNLRAGDADQDLDFDQLDLVQVQLAAKYLTGQPATWGEGDWNGAPGGSQGNPPAGDGLFDQLDIIAAAGGGTYLTGPYATVQPNGQRGDNQTSLVYDANTGELAIDAPAGTQLTSINIDSAAGVFSGAAAANLGGSFDNDADNNIFKATFGGSFGSLSFGNVAQPGLTEAFMLGDLSVVGSLAGGGDLGDVDLIYVPEPASVLLVAIGLVFGLVHFRLANQRNCRDLKDHVSVEGLRRGTKERFIDQLHTGAKR